MTLPDSTMGAGLFALLFLLGGGGLVQIILKLMDWRVSRANVGNAEAATSKTIQETVQGAVQTMSQVLETVEAQRIAATAQVTALMEQSTSMQVQQAQDRARLERMETRQNEMEDRERRMIAAVTRHRVEWDIPTHEALKKYEPDYPAPPKIFEDDLYFPKAPVVDVQVQVKPE